MIGWTNIIGNSGDGLEIKVVGGLTPPTNPEVNTIWIETEIPINYIQLGKTFDTNVIPLSGDIQIILDYNYSNNTKILITEKNIALYLSGCLQYNGTLWLVVNAKVYYNSEWIQFSDWQHPITNKILNPNYKIKGLTSGIEDFIYTSESYGTSVNGRATMYITDQGIHLSLNRYDRNNIYELYLDKPIFLTNQNILTITMSGTQLSSQSNFIGFGLISESLLKHSRTSMYEDFSVYSGTSSSFSTTITKSLENLEDGIYYFVIRILQYESTSSNNSSVKVTDISFL